MNKKELRQKYISVLTKEYGITKDLSKMSLNRLSRLFIDARNGRENNGTK